MRVISSVVAVAVGLSELPEAETPMCRAATE
jgi:hypothetical protein